MRLTENEIREIVKNVLSQLNSPAANRKTAVYAIDMINRASLSAGGPGNIACAAEDATVQSSGVLMKLIDKQNCYLASEAELARLQELIFMPKGLNRACVGRDAAVLLEMIGVKAPVGVRCIVFFGEKEHPFIAEELMMPVLGMVRADDFDDGVKKAVWIEHGYRHSAHIHSKNVDRITAYARAMDTAILVKNAPSYAALGFGGEGYCSFTIASRTGEGLTSAATFTKQRRCVMSDSLCIR